MNGVDRSHSSGKQELFVRASRAARHQGKRRIGAIGYGLSWAMLRGCLLTWLLISLATIALAQKPASDLTTASLEDLMNIEVTSVSKKEEKLFQTAAAVYVITSEDIRRSGFTSIPDLLRMAPGLNVARIDGSKWAISARGFNGRCANKLLVLID